MKQGADHIQRGLLPFFMLRFEHSSGICPA